jgi:hypothetical protein
VNEAATGLNLPERVRRSLAAAVADRGPQARIISARARDSMRPPQAHIVVAATEEEIGHIRGEASLVRRFEFYKTFYGPVVRVALSVYPPANEPLSAATVLNVSQVSGDTALSGLGKQKELYIHFYAASGGDLLYQFSKQLPNAQAQREEAKQILQMARDAYGETPEERRSFGRAVRLAERQFELPVPPPE